MMNTEERGPQLHDKVSRGESLTPEEQKQLEEWYALEDQQESEALGLNRPAGVQSGLQAQIEAALEQLVKITNRIQKIASENETLRQENAELRRQLGHLFGSQSA